MVKEFLAFLKRGNVMDLAVAVVLGGAFGAIIASLVNDIIMPLIGIILGGVNFTSLMVKVGGAEVKYGNFLQALVNFFIIALVIFLVVRSYNRLRDRFDREEKVEKVVAPAEDVVLLTEIRDLLREQNQLRRP